MNLRQTTVTEHPDAFERRSFCMKLKWRLAAAATLNDNFNFWWGFKILHDLKKKKILSRQFFFKVWTSSKYINLEWIIIKKKIPIKKINHALNLVSSASRKKNHSSFNYILNAPIVAYVERSCCLQSTVLLLLIQRTSQQQNDVLKWYARHFSSGTLKCWFDASL